MKNIICCILATFLFSVFSKGQSNPLMLKSGSDSVKVVPPAKLRSSPMLLTFYKTDNIYIKIVYGSPLKKGRKIFGDLVPYGKLWRTGANEASEINFTKDIKILGKRLKAGTYTIFTIPNMDKWTVVINSELGQWGDFEYKQENNILTFDVPLENTPKEIYEAFTIKFEDADFGANMILRWDDVKVAVPIALN